MRKRPAVSLWLVAVVFLVAGFGTGLFFLAQYAVVMVSSGEVNVDLRELWARGSYSEIISYTENELEKDPLDLGSLIFSGFSYFYSSIPMPEEERRSALFSAVRNLRRALLHRHPPLIPEIHYILGKSYYHLGRYYADLAVKHLKEAQNLRYIASDLNEYLGLALSALGRHEASLEFFKKALEEKDSPILRWSLGFTYFQLGQTVEAERQLRLALETTDDRGLEQKCRFLLGELFLVRQEWDKAEAEYSAILASDPNSADAHFFLGEILLGRNEPEKARAQWRRAFQLDPLHYNAAQRLRRN